VKIQKFQLFVFFSPFYQLIFYGDEFSFDSIQYFINMIPLN